MTASPTAAFALVDSSAFYALMRTVDEHHRPARAILTRLSEEGWRTVTTNFVVAETHALVLSRLGRDRARAFLREFERSDISIIRVHVPDEERARRIIFQYEDKDFSYTDATSFAVMERYDIAHAFAFDHHFVQFGLSVLQA